MATTDVTGAELTARKRERNEAHSFFASFFPVTNKWMQDKPFPENLLSLLETQLPRSPDFPGTYQQVECGICYDDEHGAKSGSGTEYMCENTNCSSISHLAIVPTVYSRLQLNSTTQSRGLNYVLIKDLKLFTWIETHRHSYRNFHTL
ncbi:hypothetical protein SLA2020_205790 [Shorea laevis]